MTCKLIKSTFLAIFNFIKLFSLSKDLQSPPFNNAINQFSQNKTKKQCNQY